MNDPFSTPDRSTQDRDLAPWERRQGREDERSTSRSPIPLSGTLFGVVPYDFTLPTPEKIRGRLWNPYSDKLFGPHLFGAGWAPNFGAMAVKLGVIEPDAEDDPMNTFPGEAWAAAAILPSVLAAASALTDKDLPRSARIAVVASAVGFTGAVLTGLAVAGRRVEQRRDGLA